DTSFLPPLVLEEKSSRKIEAYVTTLPAGDLYLSHWTRLEFSSLVAREVRMHGLTPEEGQAVLLQFDQLVEESYRVLLPTALDYELAGDFIKLFATGLRAGDALHLAIARNHGATKILTLDEGMLKAGKQLKLPVSPGIRM
ncbi:MAG: type II toxin-antitoxin system VapC family toxin, partial [Gammaproteobacteria bacterium]